MSNYPDDIDYQNKRGNSPFADDDDEEEYESDYVDRSGYAGRNDLVDYQDKERDSETDRRN